MSTHRHIAARAHLPLAVVAACALLGWLAVPAVAGAAAPVLTTATVAGFVPAWDGEDDAARVTVTVAAPTTLGLDVVDAAGRHVRTLVASAPFAAGSTDTYWDGYVDGGAVAAPGSYRVVAHVLDGLGSAAGSGPGAAPVAASQPSASVTVLATPLSIAGLQLQRGFIAARAAASATNAGFTLSQRGFVAAAVVGADGRVVRNLYRGRMRAGAGSVRWDGRTDAGRRAPDGRYELVIAGTGGGMPTATLRAPLIVDTSIPGLFLPQRRVVARLHGRALLARLPLRVSEAARVFVSLRGGRHAWSARVGGGRGSVRLNVGVLGVRSRGRAARQQLVVTVVDVAGNARRARMTLVVPALGRHRTAYTVTTPPPAPTPAPVPAPAPAPTPGPVPAPVTPPGSGMLWPAHGVFTSPFGPRGTGFHSGIDIAGPTGTPIVAAAAGIVSFAGTMSGYGFLVIVQHPGGVETRYAHQSKIVAVVGQQLSRGELLGYVGATGHATGPHLHFEVRVDGIAHDPLHFLPAGGPPA